MENKQKSVSNKKRLRVGWVVTIILVVVLLVFGGGYIHYSNSLNSVKQDYEQQQGDLQSALQRRSDLIPNLVNSVKGSMGQEKKGFARIIRARKEYNDAAKSGNIKDQASASEQLSSATTNLINIINDKYPKLSSEENVRRLMGQLEGAENRINLASKKYNTAIKTYNDQVSSFPASIVAKMKNMQTKHYFKADKNAPKVSKVDPDN